MWHLHGHDQLWWSDEEVLKLHSESCPHKDCNPEGSPDPAEYAVECLNETSSEHNAPLFVCADDCDVCRETADHDHPLLMAPREIPIDDDVYLEAALFPWLDDPNCDIGD